MLDLVVVGSINLDVSVPVDHLPQPGETVLGGDAMWSPGGKGANQAVAAARLGRSVAMIGCVGNDPAGTEQRRLLADNGVDVDAVQTLDAVPTGLATIAVSTDGENSIVVSPGANARVSADTIDTGMISARALLAQFEVPAQAIAAALSVHEGLVVVNPAPARSLAADLFERIDVLVPNQGELSVLAGADTMAATTDEMVDQARSLGAGATVITLGGDGALVVEAQAVTSVPVVPVSVVDTTGAGDSFCAGLVDALLDGASLPDAAVWATRVAAVTVTRRGAQVSLPTRAEVEAGS